MSYADAAVITPSDTAVLPRYTKGLCIGGGGGGGGGGNYHNVAVRMKNGTTLTITGLAVGVIHALEVDQVLATGTNATTVVALY
jgi:hypothetical protein